MGPSITRPRHRRSPDRWATRGRPTAQRGARLPAPDPHLAIWRHSPTTRLGTRRYPRDAGTWNGTAWSGVDGDRRPPGRGSAAVAWDQARHSLFVFGGIRFNATGGPGAQGTLLGDTWILAGGQWISVVPAGPPPLSLAHAIWDPSAKRVPIL